MAIYLIRHTSPDLIEGICCGQTDINVSATFEEEYSELLPLFTDIKIDKIYTSPLKRSRKLAERISGQLNLPLFSDARLKELNYGIWEMQPWSKIPPTELNLWMVDFINLKTPHGESYAQLFKRVNQFLNNNDLRNSLIVSHSGVMRCILSSLTNTPLNDSYKKFQFDYRQIYEIDILKRTYKIKKFDTSWKIK